VNGSHMIGIQGIKYAGNILSDPAHTGVSIMQAALMGAKTANNLIANSFVKKFGFDHYGPVFI